MTDDELIAIAAFIAAGKVQKCRLNDKTDDEYDGAENRAELRNERFGRARLGGATVSQALDESNGGY